MAALYNSGLKPLGNNPTQPYQHAAKLFLEDNFRLAPKQSFLYYVVINFDPSVREAEGIFANLVSFAERYQFFETGMLVKRAELPKFQIDTKILNAYNRKNVLTTKINYENVNLTFHDDAADVVTNFWNDYYTYYFRDSDYDPLAYRQLNRYNLRSKVGWGFSPRNQSLPSLLSNIRIFSLHNKRFTEYMLVNPVITQWRHGELDSSESTGILTNTMTVNYETVKYFTGYVDPVVVDGFTLLHYDNRPSPLATSTTNFYSSAGILGVIDGVAKDLKNPDGTNGAGGPLSNLLTLYKTYNNLKGVNFKNAVSASLGQLVGGVANQVLNGRNPFAFPTTGSNSTSQVAAAPVQIGNSGIARITDANGGSLIAASAPGVNSGSNIIDQGLAFVNRGIQTGINATTNFVRTGSIFDSTSSGGRIAVNASTLQVPTGSATGILTDSSGRAVSSFTTLGAQAGTFNPSNIEQNKVSTQTTFDEVGNKYFINTYQDGTQVTLDSNNRILSTFPGRASNATNINTNPIDARTLAANGGTINQAGPQYRTDPKTGLVYTVGGTTSAQITNTLTGTAGVASGLVAGQAINAQLNKSFLGDSVIGRTVSAAIATSTGSAIGRAVNNGLQPIVNTASGAIVQGWDKVTGEIKNVVGSWTGTGGYDPQQPWKNVVSSVEEVDEEGFVSVKTTYKDGTQVFEDNEGNQLGVLNGSNNGGLLSFFNKTPGQNTDDIASSPGVGSYLTDGSGNPVYSQSGEVWNYTGTEQDTSDYVSREGYYESSSEGPNIEPWTPTSDDDSWSEWSDWG